MSDTVKTLDELLDASRTTDGFKAAVRSLADKSDGAGVIRFAPNVPPVKALRVIMKLLEEQPDLQIESVEVDGASGCSDFSGDIVVEPGAVAFDFVWDCKWRAEQMGWKDFLGLPDQVRAAREFGYQCFESFAKSD